MQIMDRFRGGRMARTARVVLAGALWVGLAVPSWGLTIFTNEIPSGGAFPTGGAAAGPAPDGVGETITGGGTLASIVRAAADVWEAAILTAHNITVSFGWGSLTAPTVGSASVPGGTPPASASLRFDNDGTSWFMDSTPLVNEEFGALTSLTAALSGDSDGLLVSAFWAHPLTGGDADGQVDLFTVALHEIGHALGLTSSRTGGGATMTVNNPGLPHQGGMINLDPDGVHLDYTNAVMNRVLTGGDRRLLSSVDVLAVAEAGGFGSANLDPYRFTTPEPSTILLLSSGFLIIGIRRWRQGRSQKV